VHGRETDGDYHLNPPPGLAVTRWLGKKGVVRDYVQVPGISPSGVAFVHNRSLRNLARGLVERVLYLKQNGVLVSVPRPSLPHFAGTLRSFKVQLLKKLPESTPVALEDFPSLYNGLRKEVAEQAVASLLVEPLCRKDSMLKFFVKYEKLLKDSAPRIISPRDPRYNAVVGRWLKPCEHLLFTGIARVFGEPTVMKGYDALDTARHMKKKWDRFTRPVAVGLDASRFDQHVSYAALVWEHSVYNSWFKDPEFARAISMQLINEGTGYTDEGKIKVQVEGCRMSGDMNTSAGNCLLMCAMIWAYAKSRNVVISLANNGDDCVVFMESSDFGAFSDSLDDWFKGMGFDMKVEPPVYTFEHIEFCQAHPVAINETTYIMVRDPVASLTKDGMALINANHPDSVASWCASVGTAGLAVYGCIPVLHAFYAYYCRQGSVKPRWAKAYAKRGFDYLRGTLDFSKSSVSEYSRYSFYLAFGVFPDEQIEMERYFSRLPPLVHSVPTHGCEAIPGLDTSIDILLTLARNASKNT
jgi:hypothetical protein